jgi:hypothetical protein
MPQLQKATLQAIGPSREAEPLEQAIEVQFNPASLTLRLSNAMEGGESRGRQARQHLGASSTVLSMDLEFDTADEGSADAPRSVREKTALVERFVLPSEGADERPPKLRFRWGNLVFDGIVESLDITFDHFAENGVPLRAKLGLSIKEQEPRYQFLEAGRGANRRTGSAPGSGGAGLPGTAGLGLSASLSAGLSVGLSAQAGLALEGELAVDFAARAGLEPAAWRGLDADLSAGLSLSAGAEVGFDAGLSAGPGLGVSAGVQAGAGASLEAGLGLEVGLSAGFAAQVGAGAELSAGYALSAAGGVDAALARSATAAHEAGADRSLAAFGLAGSASGGGGAAASTGGTGGAAQTRGGVLPAGSARARPATPSAPAAAPGGQAATPLPPARPDPRAAGYGAGVPLRPRAESTAAPSRPTLASADAPVGRRTVAGVPLRSDPTLAPWEALPARDPGRARADAAQAKRRRPGPCGYLGGVA